ncbi:MAG: Holliday junction branch migration protein RuvA [Actinobacteria bacterium]|jgi:Holliday junction DNA helicase RuvA|uniref:Unannotated protein n=1 Tax=freshwater metagenome TaxID=449393 RepID=A0A6J6DAD3_9ZZZZ|nr:Holliday junction branch migration protein RuvA [Actinomycetota bacterium]
MIGRVIGEVIERIDGPHHSLVTVLVSGLGIEVHAPRVDLEQATEQARIDLFTDFVIREDAMTLYGFATSARRSLFRLLQTVTGVGPKVALTILATTETDDLMEAIVDGDLAYLERIPGIGKKVASRISLELREKMSLPKGGSKSSVRNDVVSALINLGYGEREASAAASELGAGVEIDVALKEALSRLNRTKR